MDVFFYHLEQQTLERVLPSLLEKTLARGWRAVVQVGNEDRLEALDQALWTYADDSFLPHGTARVGHASEQPVYLTLTDENQTAQACDFSSMAPKRTSSRAPNGLSMFSTDMIRMPLHRRAQWKAAKAAGCAVTYWQQSQSGRWEQKA